MSLEIITLFILSSAVLALLPGPAMMLVINHAIVSGYRKALPTVAGIVIADILLLFVILLGIGSLIVASPIAYKLLTIVCTLYLLYLGVVTIAHARKGATASKDHGGIYGFQSGLTVTLTNPKTLAFLLAYFPQFVDERGSIPEPAQLVILAVFFVVVVLIIMLLYAFFADRIRPLLKNPRIVSLVQQFFGIILIGMGLSGLLSFF